MPASSCWYYAYGSNMNPLRVTTRGLKYTDVRAGQVAGLGLRFNKQAKDHPDCGHANLVYAPDEVAEGVLYRLAHPAMIELMDPFERAPVNYSREPIPVATPEGVVIAWTYFANAAVLRNGLLPSREYLDHLLAGEPWLSPAYFKRLVTQPVSAPRE